ncbi:MAG: TonB-dependent receptor [Steroidobacteraceae bacterium]
MTRAQPLASLMIPHGIVCAILVVSAGPTAEAASLDLTEVVRVNIPAEPLTVALLQFSSQVHVQVATSGTEVGSVHSHRVSGAMSIGDALTKLLSGTGFSFQVSGDRSIAILLPDKVRDTMPATGPPAGTRLQKNDVENKDQPGENSMRHRNLFARFIGLFAVCGSAIHAGSACAQDVSTTRRSSGAEAQLEEVVVTAQRYAESLQKTPVSVVAVSGDELQTLGVANLETLDSFIPNFSAGFGQGYSNWAVLTIRGVGGGEGFLYQDPSVGIYIDDVYYPRAQGAMLDLIDVEQVEVLRGPQGTLFGRNTSGGAVRYISKKPERELSGNITGSVGNLKRRDMQSIANIPLSDTLSSRFTFASKSSDGFVTRLNDGVKMGDLNVVAVRGQLRWQPTAQWDINLSADSIRTFDHGVARKITLIDTTDLYPTRLGNPGFNASLVTPSLYTVVGGDPDKNENESNGLTGTIQYDVNNNLSIKSLTGYRYSNATNIQDWDQTPFLLFTANTKFNFSNESQEFQFNGNSFEDRLKWVAGLYYFHEKAHQNGVRNDPVEPPNNPEIRDLDTTSYAAFGQGTFKLTDHLGATAGIRWSHDDKKYFSLRGPFSGSNSGNWTSITPRFGLNYQIADDMMSYVSAAKGFKSGGFNDTPRSGQLNNGINPYGPENLWTYESGIRSEFANRRIRFNGTFFYTDYKDIQTLGSFFDPVLGTVILVTQNAAAATVKGIELETQVRVTSGLVMRLSGGWTDARYDDVTGATTLTLNTPFQRTPKYSYTAGATYDHSLAHNDKLSFNIDYSWKDDQTNSNNENLYVVLPAYGLLSSRVTYSPQSDKWKVSLFGTNLLNKKYLVNAYDPSTRLHLQGFASNDLGRPREWGVEVSVIF